jgi:hypothetical protein
MTVRDRALELALGLLLASCGAKTGLFVGGAGEEGMDAAGPSDAGPDSPVVGIDGCTEIRLEVTVTPTVMLVVDQSGSMDFELGDGRTRWDALRRSLVGPRGLVTDFETRIRFGLALYSARSELGEDGGPPIGECPLITDVEPDVRNLVAIRSAYDASEPIEDTPTGDALDAVRARVLELVDPRLSPTIFILATDGEPDTCLELDPQNGQEEAVAAATRAFEAGIRTFVIGVGADTVSRSHLSDMANAGVGRGPGEPPASFWQVDDDAGLRAALRDILRNEASCEVLLERRVDLAQACRGTIVLNGRPLVCEDPNGWRLSDARHVELLGEACDEVVGVAGSTIEAIFPCDAVLE